ncbi:alcohol dehydrogenase catalytic domain-containing protein [Streptomyces iranensis]|uniref:alcohol dehydrogenase catalytic domain-containing protein n=1 Tax=Streptomyces iranensis TaxID=576784 RepID=UPI0035567207
MGITPGEAAIRQMRSAEPGGRIILGWEFAGVVEAVGPEATGFAVGDRVMGTGDMSRDGAWAERLAVDHRVVARIPAAEERNLGPGGEHGLASRITRVVHEDGSGCGRRPHRKRARSTA